MQAILQAGCGRNSADSCFLQHCLSPSLGVEQNVKDGNIHSPPGEIFGENTSSFAKADDSHMIDGFLAPHISYGVCYAVRENSGGVTMSLSLPHACRHQQLSPKKRTS